MHALTRTAAVITPILQESYSLLSNRQCSGDYVLLLSLSESQMLLYVLALEHFMKCIFHMGLCKEVSNLHIDLSVFWTRLVTPKP